VPKQLLAALLVGSAATAMVIGSSLPAGAATNPIRWNTGGAVWSTNQGAVDTFVDSGEVTDRGLQGGLARSGWSSQEVRAGLSKSYTVDLIGVSGFLNSDAGVKFLKNATASYFPYASMNTYAVQALRSAIIKDAADGAISAVGIMRALPVDFRLADSCNTYTGAQNICAEGRCQPGTAQCTSLFSWYVFLPACIQANQVPNPLDARLGVGRQSAQRGMW